MKFILLSLQLLFVTCGFCQKAKPLDTINFCGYKYRVPEGCQTKRDFQLQCGEYNLQWIYMSDEKLKTMPYQFMGQLALQMVDLQKEIIAPVVMDKKLKGYRVSYKSQKGTQYQLIAFGTINNQPVLVQYVADKEPRTNEDIPEFAKQIIRLTK